MSLRRRTFLGSSLAALSLAVPRVGTAAKNRASGGPRAVSLDLTATQLAVSAGLVLVGAASASSFQGSKADIALAKTVVDVGQSAEPNLELLQDLAPDVFVTAWPIAADSPLRKLAPVFELDIFNERPDRYSEIRRAVISLGQFAGTEQVAHAAVLSCDARIERLGADIRLPMAPLYLVNLNQDGVNLLVYGRHSLMDGVLRRFGTVNAWRGGDEVWGWAKTGPEALAQTPEAIIIHIEQYWQGSGLAMKRLIGSPLWQALPQIQSGRLLTLAPIDIFGGLQSTERFASLLRDALPPGRL